MNHSTPGLPVHNQLQEFTQTHAHQVGDAIQPSHPLSPPSPPAPNPPQHQGLSNESTLLMRWLKYWSFSFSISLSNEHPGLISFRMDWLDLLAVFYLGSPRVRHDWVTAQAHITYRSERKRDSKRLYHFLRNVNCSTQRSLSDWGLQHGGDEILLCAQIFVVHLFTLELPWICLRILPFK